MSFVETEYECVPVSTWNNFDWEEVEQVITEYKLRLLKLLGTLDELEYKIKIINSLSFQLFSGYYSSFDME